MKKVILLLLIFLACPAFGDYAYVSPESYAVNEADMLDHLSIPRTPKLNIDNLESSKPINYVSEKVLKHKKSKQIKKENRPKQYEDTLKYKFARWWVDERYKREEAHHGTKHEIKVQKRIEKETEAKKVVDN